MEAAPLKEIRQPVPLLGLLDFCKGIAIVWVMLVHAIHGWFGWQGVHVLTLAGIIAASCLLSLDRSGLSKRLFSIGAASGKVRPSLKRNRLLFRRSKSHRSRNVATQASLYHG